MHRTITRLGRIALSLVASVSIAGAASAASFTGPISPYYLDNSSDRTIYVVQGTSIINSFPWSYACGSEFCESNLAISNGHVNTNWFGTWAGSGIPGQAGQYTLGGTPTGVSWTNTLPPGTSTIYELLVDGTSDGIRNYTVEAARIPGPTRVIATNLHWQNPRHCSTYLLLPDT